MNQRRTIAAVSLLVILGGLLAWAGPQATTKAPAQTNNNKTATEKKTKKKVTTKIKHHPVVIHPVGPGKCKASPDNQQLRQHNQDYSTWNVAGGSAAKYIVKFEHGTPCDSGLDEFEIPGGGVSTACTVQKVDTSAGSKSYKYTIYKDKIDPANKCADPSVQVCDGGPC